MKYCVGDEVIFIRVFDNTAVSRNRMSIVKLIPPEVYRCKIIKGIGSARYNVHEVNIDEEKTLQLKRQKIIDQL